MGKNLVAELVAEQVTKEGLVLAICAGSAIGLVCVVAPDCINFRDSIMLAIGLFCYPLAATLVVWSIIWVLNDVEAYRKRRKALITKEKS